MIGLLYFTALALVGRMLLVVWPAPVCLVVSVLTVAVSVFGLRAVARAPVQAAEQAIGMLEARYGATMVLALLFRRVRGGGHLGSVWRWTVTQERVQLHSLLALLALALALILFGTGPRDGPEAECQSYCVTYWADDPA